MWSDKFEVNSFQRMTKSSFAIGLAICQKFYKFPIQWFNVKVRVDRYGRIVLPKEIREMLGIHENSELTLSLREDEIVIRVEREDLEKKVDDLIEFLKNNAPKAFVSEVEEENKWLTRKYSLEKIGLKE